MSKLPLDDQEIKLVKDENCNKKEKKSNKKNKKNDKNNNNDKNKEIKTDVIQNLNDDNKNKNNENCKNNEIIKEDKCFDVDLYKEDFDEKIKEIEEK